MTFITWLRESWFYFNIFNNNLRWHDGHGHHTHCPGQCHHAPLFLLFGLSLCCWNIFLFLWEKRKEKKLMKSCDKTMLLQDVNQLTTILTRSNCNFWCNWKLNGLCICVCIGNHCNQPSRGLLFVLMCHTQQYFRVWREFKQSQSGQLVQKAARKATYKWPHTFY